MCFFKRVYALGACLLLPTILWAQKVENVVSAFDGQRVVITYDLIHSDSARKFAVQVFSSADDFLRPLAHVTGAVGLAVKPGRALKIIWSVRQELPPDFDKDIRYKIKATLVPLTGEKVKSTLSKKESTTTVFATETNQLFTLTAPIACRRGKKYEVHWSGTNPNDPIRFELYDAANAQKIIGRAQGSENSWQWEVPPAIKTGRYTLKVIFNTKTMDAVTQPLHIRHKTPFVVKILPLAAAGAALLLIGNKTGNAPLPGPINPN